MGGTFDPIHIAHLRVAEETRNMLSLDQILFIPAGNPWMKKGNVVASPQQRLEMVQLAIRSNPHFKISTVELDRPGNSYTVDTLIALKEQTKDAALYFILGWDTLEGLQQWKEPSQVRKLCTLVAVPRPGHNRPCTGETEQADLRKPDEIIFLETSPLDIRGTELRRRVSEGISIDSLVPVLVEQYIKRNHLYQE